MLRCGRYRLIDATLKQGVLRPDRENMSGKNIDTRYSTRYSRSFAVSQGLEVRSECYILYLVDTIPGRLNLIRELVDI
jgi:hypothetical protein